MRMQVLSLLFLLPSLLLAVPGDMCDNWKVGNVWQDGYEAHLLFIADHEVHGWNVNLQFDGSVDSLVCYDGVVHTTDHKNWRVENLNWDGDFDLGEEVFIGFQVEFAGTAPDLIHADFDGVEHPICGSGGQDTTTKRTTTSTTPRSTTNTAPPTTTQAGGCGDIFHIETEEEGAWNGVVAITTTSHVVGWEVHLTFDVPVDTVESTLATVSGSRTEWKLHSKSFNEDFPEGQTLELSFKTSYSDSKPDVVRVGFNGQILCRAH